MEIMESYPWRQNVSRNFRLSMDSPSNPILIWDHIWQNNASAYWQKKMQMQIFDYIGQVTFLVVSSILSKNT